MIQALKKLGIEGMFLNIIQAIYNKPIANNIALEFLARAIRQKEKIKGFK
jgi:hypothetical protein